MTIQRYLIDYLQERPMFLSLIRAKEADLFSRFLPLRNPVLDVGCGDGFFAKLVFGRVAVGLDIKESRIGQAKAAGAYRKIVTYDGRNFPFPANQFGTIVSNCVLEHIADVRSVVDEMYRVLAPGGMALVSVMAKPWEDHLVGSMVLGHAYAAWMRKKQVHMHLYTNNEWRRVFLAAGFRVEKAIGYLSPAGCRLIDIGHYLSLPSLLTYGLFGKWVLWRQLARWYPVRLCTHIMGTDVAADQAGALFFVLQKSSRRGGRRR